MIQQSSAMQCPMCFRPFDEKDHIPYDICKESHSLCSNCLIKIKNSKHSNCFVCRNVLKERINKLAQQLLRIVWSLKAVGQLKPQTEIARQNFRSDVPVLSQVATNKRQNSPAKDTDTDNLVKTAFFPNYKQLVATNQPSIQPQLPSAKMLGKNNPQLLPSVPSHHNQSQLPMQQLQQYNKAITDKIQNIQAQQNEVNTKYQQLTYKNQQQPVNAASQELLSLQKQHTVYQHQLDKLKKHQQDLYNQMRIQQQTAQNITPSYINPPLAASFNKLSGPTQKPSSSIHPQQSPSSQKQFLRKPQPPQQPSNNGKILPTTNDNKMFNLPSQK